MGKYIYSTIPLVIGLLVLLAPHLFTKIDLSLPENEKTMNKLRIAGYLAIAGGSLALIAQII
jgi:uncharacterized protein YjeT (DUF2065 family)